MNREIKFRVWHIPTKSLYDMEEINNHYFIDDNYIVIQFTGLTDKNGKEIYEGKSVLGDTIGILYWHENGAIGWSIQNEKHTDFLLSSQQYEIIGNIYENPELLK